MGNESAAALAPIPMRREVRLEASPAQLWPLIANTDRFNRALGIPAMTVAQNPPGHLSKEVRARLYGLTLTWRERPFEWVEGNYYRVVREFAGGPFARFEGGMDLAADSGGCRVSIVSDFTPRNALGGLLIRHGVGRKAVSDAEKLVKRFGEALKSDGAAPAYPRGRAKTEANLAVLAKKAEALRQAPVRPAPAERLIRFVREAYDDELSRMRPFELADRWGEDRLELLRACFYAVKAGILDLSWEIMCPSCAAATERPKSLAGMKATSHCPSCGIEYGVNFDESVELRFTSNPTVRPVETHVYCVGNPSQTPFAAAQLVLRPGEPREMELELSAETYGLRDLTNGAVVRLRPSADGSSELRLDLSKTEKPREARFKPGAARLHLEPSAAGEALVRLERESWRDKGAKASLVTTLQEFRDLFSSEVLSPGVEIGVKNVALLFSDLKDSTALYEKVGEAAAYALVRDHFDYLFDIVARRRGAVVKTIGDAVMAVFSTGAAALEAAFEIQERIGELNARLSPRPPVTVKLGLHQGPAIAINSGGVLDYFGTTVNVSARVQNESQGGDIVVTESLLEDPAVKSVLRKHPHRSESFRIKLKGLSDVFQLRRLLPHA